MNADPMPPLPGDLPDFVREAITGRIAELREAAADRPAHAAWLEACIDWEFSERDPDAMPDAAGRRGLSQRAAGVIEEEAAWLAEVARQGGTTGVARPDGYVAMRRQTAASAQRAAETRNDPFRSLFGPLNP